MLKEEANSNFIETNVFQNTYEDSLVLEIEDSDLVSDRGQDAGRNPMDVTGYVVQFKQANVEWSGAQEKVLERSKKEEEEELFEVVSFLYDPCWMR